jgi:hypothetical protein
LPLIVLIVSFNCAIGNAQDSQHRRGDYPKETLTSCQATARRTELVGRTVTLSGRFYLGPSASADAPMLLRDLASCDVKDAQFAVLIRFPHTAQSTESTHLEELRRDLVPTPCKPHAICLPARVSRLIYADLVVTGHFGVVPPDARVYYCCSFDVDDVISVGDGPVRSLAPR